MNRNINDLKKSYDDKAHQCKYRKDRNNNPIKMLLTFNEWLEIWQQSGHLEEMGDYVMSRHNDVGHYETSNVKIQTRGENTKEAWLGRQHSTQTKEIFKQQRKGKNFRNGVKNPILKCPHCGKEGGSNGMKQWHFTNCKQRNNNEKTPKDKTRST